MTREMKDSGIEWIGEIPKDWRLKPLGSCFYERNEKVSDSEWEPLSVTKLGIVKQLETAAKSDAHDSRKKVCIGDFVINSRSDRKQSCGVSQYDGSVSLINIVLVNRSFELNYVKYLLKNYVFAEEFYRWGTGIVADLWSTKWERMSKIMLPIPSIEEQKRIGFFLDSKIKEIDKAITLAKASIEDYKKYKQSIITEAVTKGLNPDVEMKDSGIEWIGYMPKEWHSIKIKYVSHISRGLFNHRPRSDKRYYDGIYPFIQTSDVAKSNKYITTYSQTLNEFGKSVSKEFPKGTLTMTIAANVGDVAILDFDAYFPDSIVGFVPNNESDNIYLYYIFKAMKKIFILSSTISTQLNLNIDRVKELYIPYSSNQIERQQIVNYLDQQCQQIDKMIADKETLIKDLEDYKKSLIYEYVTGKKEVK